MKNEKINKKVFFWVTGEKFDENNNIDRIYDEMKYNFYLPSNLANGLAENDFGAITNISLEQMKDFAKNQVKNFINNNSFCYVIEKEFSFTEEEWNLFIEENGKINLSKFGIEKFPEYEEPTYSVKKRENNEIEENAIHIKTQDEIEPILLNIVTSKYNEGFRLLNNLYNFSEKSDLFLNCKDLEKLNKSIQEKNQNNLTNVQKLDKLGKSLESMIPLKILCYMISDAKLLFGNRKEYSADEIENNRKENEEKENKFNNEKKQMINEIKDYSRKVGINIENIFSQDGKLLDRKLTIDNPEFAKKLMNTEIKYESENNTASEEIGD